MQRKNNVFPYVLAINLPSGAAWKSQHTPPSTSHTHTYILTTTLNSIILNFFLKVHPLHDIPTHASILSGCLSGWPAFSSQ